MVSGGFSYDFLMILFLLGGPFPRQVLGLPTMPLLALVQWGLSFIGIGFDLVNQCGEHGVHPPVPMFGPPLTTSSGGGPFSLASGLHH